MEKRVKSNKNSKYVDTSKWILNVQNNTNVSFAFAAYKIKAHDVTLLRSG